ncbi:hypothetical protein REJC140_01588 [Pseudorhizobium endolithicum]|uniref:Secreted protein n=1 Tax=Pseudorhizobium endolithicum TaxID=1191678 RepID=A0ABM8PV39_9HYPH|nr:hypothetical protein REQ54_04478 [Rhizobium sp. Q54]CAD7050037.1 hypothetical protein REJC140_01588 [Pseudorhizobium endolithicum]
MKILVFSLAAILAAGPAFSQTGASGTGAAETAPMPDTNAGGPVGSTAVPRGNTTTTTQTDPNRSGTTALQDCETMPGTSAQVPPQGGSDNPQPQERCPD